MLSGRVRVLSERVMIPGREASVRSVMEKVVHRVRQFPGFIRGEVLSDTKRPELYCILTEWESFPHLQTWIDHPDYKVLVDEMDGLLGKPTSYQVFHRHRVEIFLL